MALLLLGACQSDDATPPDDSESMRLTVMVFNAWGAGSNDGRSVDETIAVLRAANPDIIGLLEAQAESVPCTAICPPAGESRAPQIARELGYFLYEQQQENEALWANAILSRYPIRNSTANDLGVIIDIGERSVAMFGIHLTDFPYQPYQLLGIEYDDAPMLDSESETIAAANKARGPGLDLLMSDLKSVAEVDAVFVVGDFNEPSHRDWTDRAVKIGRHPLRVAYPTALRLEGEGFVDTYRAMFPDEIDRPGYTWTPALAPDDPSDHLDRIDYVFVRAAGVVIESAAVVGESQEYADIVVEPWPSDHRAVVATVLVP